MSTRTRPRLWSLCASSCSVSPCSFPCVFPQNFCMEAGALWRFVAQSSSWSRRVRRVATPKAATSCSHREPNSECRSLSATASVAPLASQSCSSLPLRGTLPLPLGTPGVLHFCIARTGRRWSPGAARRVSLDAAMSQKSTGQSTARKPAGVVADLSSCRYGVVHHAALSLGWRVADEGSEDWDVQWLDKNVIAQRVLRLAPWQRINHFVGMDAVSSKPNLVRTLRRLPPGQEVSPQAWLLPGEASAFAAALRSNPLKGGKTFIVKPEAECQGRGIFLARRPEDVPRGKLEGGSFVAQQYVERPLLLGGHKFDLRVYVLVTSAAPLRVFLFDDGLVRLCASPYRKPHSSNLATATVHLTNFAINRHAEAPAAEAADGTAGSAAGAHAAGAAGATATPAAASGEGQGSAAGVSGRLSAGTAATPAAPAAPSLGPPPPDEAAPPGASQCKRSIHWLMRHLRSEGVDAAAVWARVADCINRTLLAARPELEHGYVAASRGSAGGSGRRCFELLGVDVLLDRDLRPWVIEVNHSPSLVCGSALDWRVKHGAVSEALDMLGQRRGDQRRARKQSARAAKSRLYAAAAAPSPRAPGGEAAPGAGSCAAGPSAAEQRARRLERSRARMFWRTLPVPGSEPGDPDCAATEVDTRVKNLRERARVAVSRPEAAGPTDDKFGSTAASALDGAGYDAALPWGEPLAVVAAHAAAWQAELRRLASAYPAIESAVGRPPAAAPPPRGYSAPGAGRASEPGAAGRAESAGAAGDGGTAGGAISASQLAGSTAGRLRRDSPSRSDGRPPSARQAVRHRSAREQRARAAQLAAPRTARSSEAARITARPVQVLRRGPHQRASGLACATIALQRLDLLPPSSDAAAASGASARPPPGRATEQLGPGLASRAGLRVAVAAGGRRLHSGGAALPGSGRGSGPALRNRSAGPRQSTHPRRSAI